MSSVQNVHLSIVKHIREAELVSPTAGLVLLNLTDEQIIRNLFANYRGRNETARGLRLTAFGLRVLQMHFERFDVKPKKPLVVSHQQLLFLDRTSRLPYYIESHIMSFFDVDLSVRLALVDGDLDALMEMDQKIGRKKNS